MEDVGELNPLPPNGEMHSGCLVGTPMNYDIFSLSLLDI